MPDLDREDVQRAGKPGKLSELASKRLPLLHDRRQRTLAQVRQLVGRAGSLDEGTRDHARIRQAVARLIPCGAALAFHVNESEDYARLSSGHFCGCHLLCTFCARLRAAHLVRNYSARVERVMRRPDAHTHRLVLITCTVVNGPDLLERIGKLRDAWDELHQRRRNQAKGQRGWTTLAGTLGGVASIEVKRGSGSGEWHPHLHAIAFVPVDLDAGELTRELRDEWRELCDDGSYMCDVRDVRPDADGSIHGAFCEVFKYATKGGQMSADDACDAWLLLAGDRLVRSWGCLYGVREPAQLTDTMDAMPEQLVELVMRANEHGYTEVSRSELTAEDVDGDLRRRRRRAMYLAQWLHRCELIDGPLRRQRVTMDELLGVPERGGSDASDDRDAAR